MTDQMRLDIEGATPNKNKQNPIKMGPELKALCDSLKISEDEFDRHEGSPAKFLIRRGATQEQIDAVYREPSPNPRHEREFKPFVPNPELFEFKDDVKPTGLYTDLAKRALHMNAALDYAEEVKKETKTRGQKKLRNMAGVAFEKGTGSIKAKIADGMDPIEAEFKGNLEANRFFAEYDGG